MNPLSNVKGTLRINDRELELGLTGTKKSWHDKYKDSAWIFIGGIPYDLSEGDIICVFSQYGEIVNINLVRDQKTGKSKGFAFVCFQDQRSTILSVDNLNGIKLLGRTLRVDHVENYKVPKDKDDIDPVTKKLREEGCAPKLPNSESEEEEEKKLVIPVRVKDERQKERSKKEKSKKKKKYRESESSSDTDSGKDYKKKKVKKKKRYSDSESSSGQNLREEYRKKRKKFKKKKKYSESSSSGTGSSEDDRQKIPVKLPIKKEKKIDIGYKKYDQVGAFSSDEDSFRGGRQKDERSGRKGERVYRDRSPDRGRYGRDERYGDKKGEGSRRSPERYRRSRSRSRDRRRERSTSQDRKRHRSRSRDRYRR